MNQLQAQVHSKERWYFWRTYLGVWTILAGTSLVYLVAFAGNHAAQRHIIARIQGELVGGAAPKATSDVRDMPAEIKPAQSVADTPPQRSEKEIELSGRVRALNEELAGLRDRLEKAETSVSAPESEEPTDLTAAPKSPYNAATGTLAETSPFTTASIPRVENPTPAAEPANDPMGRPSTTPSDNSAYGTGPYTGPVPSDNGRIVEEMKPATAPAVPSSGESTATEAALEPPATTPRRRKGPNLAISPLRPGRMPPLPTREADRQASAQPYAALTSPVASNAVATTPLLESSSPQAAATAPTRSSGFGAATVRHTAPPAALSLSSATSITGLRAGWLYLTTRHAAPLKGLSPRYIRNDITGTYELIAGPVADKTEANRLCGELSGEGVRCGVTVFSGTPF